MFILEQIFHRAISTCELADDQDWVALAEGVHLVKAGGRQVELDGVAAARHLLGGHDELQGGEREHFVAKPVKQTVGKYKLFGRKCFKISRIFLF